MNKDRLCLMAIQDAIRKIETCTQKHSDPNTFYADWKSFDAAMMNFVVIGEMASKLSPALQRQRKEIKWRDIQDFRNLVAHNYLGINGEEVWEIIQYHLPKLKKVVNQLLH
jgi:uncharacterized protein with HEPN domain